MKAANLTALAAAAVLAAGAHLASPAAAQEPPSSSFRESIEVRLLNLEAVVTDKDGQRIAGLQAGDFKLLIDGEAVPIEFFTEVRDGKVIDSQQAVPALADADTASTSFLVFVDEFFPMHNDKKRVLKAVAERARNMQPGDRAAVVAWDGKNLVTLSGWSSSPQDVAQAVEAAMERPSGGLHRRAERDQWIGRRPAAATAARTPGRPARGGAYDPRYRLGPQEEIYADRLVAQLSTAVGAVSAAMRGIETPPGRKALVLLSGGWPWDPAQWVAEDHRRMVSDPKYPRGAALYGALSDTANLLGYTIYGVDVPGLQSTGGVDASQRRARPRAASNEFFQEGEIHNSLYFLADETGGRALINGQRVTAFEEVAGDVRSYYWLGFSPAWGRDGERYEITIEVSDPELTVRSRNGYPDLTPQSQTRLAVQSSLLFGEAGGSDALQVAVGEPEKAKRGKLEVPIRIQVAASEVQAVERDGQWVMELDLALAAMDEGGGQAVVGPAPLVFTSPRKPKANQALSYDTTLTLRKKTTSLAIAVYDKNGDKTLTRVLVKGG